jgi:peroxiredoxin
VSRLKLVLAGLVLAAMSTVSAEPVDFTLEDLEGDEVRLSDFRGRWVLVNYWATWCPPCLEELPELESFYNRHKDRNAVVLGVNMEDIGLDSLRGFVEEQFLSYPVLRGTAVMSGVLGPVSGLPTSYLVSPGGEVVAQQMGPVTEEAITTFIANYEARNEIGEAQ